MQSYEKILYNAEIFFLFSWLKNYKKMGDMKMKETMTPQKQLIFYSFSKRLRNPFSPSCLHIHSNSLRCQDPRGLP